MAKSEVSKPQPDSSRSETSPGINLALAIVPPAIALVALDLLGSAKVSSYPESSSLHSSRMPLVPIEVDYNWSQASKSPQDLGVLSFAMPEVTKWQGQYSYSVALEDISGKRTEILNGVLSSNNAAGFSTHLTYSTESPNQSYWGTNMSKLKASAGFTSTSTMTDGPDGNFEIVLRHPGVEIPCTYNFARATNNDLSGIASFSFKPSELPPMDLKSFTFLLETPWCGSQLKAQSAFQTNLSFPLENQAELAIMAGDRKPSVVADQDGNVIATMKISPTSSADITTSIVR